MLYALITPLGRHENPGCALITAGIKHWLRSMDATAAFVYVDMITHDRVGWDVAKRADRLVVCGNPRFNLTEAKVYWDWTIWQHILASGKPFIDAWPGSSVGFSEIASPERMATMLRKIGKNRAVLQLEAKAELIIARDRTTELLCKEVNPNTVFIPCSSQWAAAEHGIQPGAKLYNAICLRRMPGYEWILKKAPALKAMLEPCRIIVHSYDDLAWASSLNPELIDNARDLLRFYAHVGRVHSFRLHGSIPAHQLGAAVTYYHNDSRKDALEPFGIDSPAFTAFPVGCGEIVAPGAS